MSHALHFAVGHYASLLTHMARDWRLLSRHSSYSRPTVWKERNDIVALEE